MGVLTVTGSTPILYQIHTENMAQDTALIQSITASASMDRGTATAHRITHMPPPRRLLFTGTIEMKFTTDTHQTRCGEPWRDLGVIDKYLWIAISLPNGGEIVRRISKKTGAEQTRTPKSDYLDYDLISIPREHNLPTSLPIEARWASKDNGGIFTYQDRPILAEGTWEVSAGFCHRLDTWLYGDNMLKDFPPEDSLHERTDDGGWERAGGEGK